MIVFGRWGSKKSQKLILHEPLVSSSFSWPRGKRSVSGVRGTWFVILLPSGKKTHTFCQLKVVQNVGKINLVLRGCEKKEEDKRLFFLLLFRCTHWQGKLCIVIATAQKDEATFFYFIRKWGSLFLFGRVTSSIHLLGMRVAFKLGFKVQSSILSVDRLWFVVSSWSNQWKF